MSTTPTPEAMTDERKEIPLSMGLVAIVDALDYDNLSKHRWYAAKNRNTYYAQRWCGKRKKVILMHREILGCKEIVDHKDGDGLHNWRDNIRAASYFINNRNARPYRNSTSRFKGVSWDSHNRAWKVGIHFNGKRCHVGQFKNEEDAALVYNVASQIIRGHGYYLNPV